MCDSFRYCEEGALSATDEAIFFRSSPRPYFA